MLGAWKPNTERWHPHFPAQTLVLTLRGQFLGSGPNQEEKLCSRGCEPSVTVLRGVLNRCGGQKPPFRGGWLPVPRLDRRRVAAAKRTPKHRVGKSSFPKQRSEK